MKKLILLLLFIPLLSIGQNDERLEGLDKVLEKALKSFNQTGFAVAVVENDKVIYSKGFGYRDYEKKIKVDTNTLFAIGSCTKAFTSSVIGLLNNKGKLNFDDSPIDYVDELRFNNPNLNELITIRDLMSHKTGIPRHDLSWYFFPTFSKDSLVSRIQYHEPVTTVRNKFYYNNFMFMLQGVVAERITNKSWEENVRESIFKPLEMERSNISIAEMEQAENAAIGYLEDYEKTDYYKIAGMSPAGSINSSVNDMSKWLITWLNDGKYNDKEILPQAYIEEAISSQNVMVPNLPSVENPGLHLANYGFGWMITSYKGHYRVQHGGNIDGFSASTSFMPSDNIGIVVLANQDRSIIPSIVQNIIYDRMLELDETDWIKKGVDEIKEAKKNQKEVEKNRISNRKEGTNPSHPIEDYVGNYINLGYGTVEITTKNDSLFLTSPYRKLWLSHYHYDTFLPYELNDGKVDMEASYDNFLITFYNNNQGEISRIESQFEQSIENPIVFDKKLKELEVEKGNLEKYVGNYKFNSSSGCKTYLKDDILYVFVPGQPEYELYPIEEHVFAFKILDGYKVEFKVNNKGKVTEISFIQPNGTFNAKRED
jgi:CubicO group peptidase (beta-lactamase class C family)